MNVKRCRPVVLALLMTLVAPAAATDIDRLRDELQALRADYEGRIQILEAKINDLQEQTRPFRADGANQARTESASTFNPAISLVLDGSYASYNNAGEDWRIESFPLGGEAGLADEGYSIGESELALSANVDDKFYGKLTLALAEHEGEVEVELEEAFFQTLALGSGISLRGGRFFSGVGYLNQQHAHAWDFADAPLVYAAMFGNKYIDDGLRLNWIAPSDLFVELGIEALRGSRFPGSGEHQGAGARVAFANLGGDIGLSHSWQTGFSYLDRTIKERSTPGKHEAQGQEELPQFTGDAKGYGISLVYKWAPLGYNVERNFKFQVEYFDQKVSGDLTILGSDSGEIARFRGNQSGYYVQAIYQFVPQWRVGLRYDRLDSSNRGDQLDVIEEAGMLTSGFNPVRFSSMLEWVPSEFSRIRLQYNHDEAYPNAGNQVLAQYTFSLGNHRGHAF